MSQRSAVSIGLNHDVDAATLSDSFSGSDTHIHAAVYSETASFGVFKSLFTSDILDGIPLSKPVSNTVVCDQNDEKKSVKKNKFMIAFMLQIYHLIKLIKTSLYS